MSVSKLSKQHEAQKHAPSPFALSYALENERFAIDYAYASPDSRSTIKQLAITLTPWLSPEVSYKDKDELCEFLCANEEPDTMTFIHIGRGGNGGNMIDDGAGDHPKVYAYCPNFDRSKVSDEMWQA